MSFGKYMVLASVLGFVAPPPAAAAQDYPQRPVRLIVPFPPGGGVDVPARLLAAKLTEAMGQQFVIDNRSGANAIIGTNLAAKATPDGYTILLVPGSHAINSGLYSKLPYDTLRDFASVSLVANGAYVLTTNATLPVNTVSDLVSLAKTKPGELTFGSGGVGNVTHLAAELLGMMARVKLVHVPYKGGAPAMTDLVAGRISLFIATGSTVGPHVRSGKVRALGVTTARRSPAFPDLPTIAEAGVPGYEVNGWYALLAPARTPAPVIDRLSRETAGALQAKEIKDKLINVMGLEPVGSTPSELDALIRTEIKKWENAIKTLGISAE
jgi:tripartite-type tricarboxylate transporter receptor subunit TctC